MYYPSAYHPTVGPFWAKTAAGAAGATGTQRGPGEGPQKVRTQTAM